MAFDKIFSKLDKRVILLKNATNLGKGAALKYGINFILNTFPHLRLIVTADCDGQHKLSDILRLASSQWDCDLIIGVREFDGKIPLRSKIGNKLTRAIFKLMFGKTLKDTQSGLRAFTSSFAKEILSCIYNGYEFEMQMLITACNKNMKILQIPIKTIYIDNNASSHFNPIFDSLSIYFVLFRHIGNSLATALIDYVVFVLSFSLGFGLFYSMMSGRIIAGSFNFIVGKTLVFKTKANLKFELFSYIALTAILMLVSMQGIKFISSYSGMSEIIIKPICEAMIFAISFLVQRLFIFTSKAQILEYGGGENLNVRPTNWEKYYSKRADKSGFKLSNITRKVSAKMILGLLSSYSTPKNICEFGGGDSCFYEAFRKVYPKSCYIVFDNAINGVNAFNAKYKDKIPHKQEAKLLNILESNTLDSSFDIVFSAGLIEHFDKEGTKNMCIKHFEATKSGGIVLITYPTPTLLYRMIRFCAEKLGVWEFFDERALKFDEVNDVCKEFGELIERKLNVFIGLTQEILVYKKY